MGAIFHEADLNDDDVAMCDVPRQIDPDGFPSVKEEVIEVDKQYKQRSLSKPFTSRFQPE